MNAGAAGPAIRVPAAVFPRPWVCGLIEPQVGERVKELGRVDVSGDEPG